MFLFLMNIFLCLLMSSNVYSMDGYHTRMDDELPPITWKECGISVRNCDQNNSFEDYFVSNRIMGGQFAITGEYPWFAGLRVYTIETLGGVQKQRTGSCGSAIINEWWLLTAAHCVSRIHSNQSIVVSIGSVSRDGGSKLVVDKVVIHPKFTKLIKKNKTLDQFIGNSRLQELKDKPKIVKQSYDQYFKDKQKSYGFNETLEYSSKDYDIALLRVKTRIVPVFNKTHYKINSICLPKTGILNHRNESAVIIGLGKTEKGFSAKQLKKGVINFLDINTCEPIFKKVLGKPNKQHMICYYQNVGSNNSLQNSKQCRGDSGSPMHQYIGCKAIQIGIISWSEYNPVLCGGHHSRWLVRVSQFVTWIRSVIRPNDIEVESQTNTLLIASVLTTSFITIIVSFALFWSMFSLIQI